MTLRVTGSLVDTSRGNRTTSVVNKQISQTDTHRQGGVLEIGTTEETITVEADIGDLGYCVFINRDTTNFVQIGVTTAVYALKLLPGEIALFPGEASVATWYLKADTAAVDVEFEFHER